MAHACRQCGGRHRHERIHLNIPTLSLHDFSPPYGSIKSLTREFSPGVHLVVGPNGVGKTSLLNSIAGTLQPRSGRIEVNGHSTEVKTANVFLVPGTLPPIPWIRSGLLLEFILSLYPSTRKTDAYRDELLQEFGLPSLMSKPLGALSAGSAKKILLTAALVAAPPIMLFDEPTNEIDAPSIEVFLNRLSTTCVDRIVLVTTHQATLFTPLAPTMLRL
jgi:ABC-2 type transport system ATP-binding protein